MVLTDWLRCWPLARGSTPKRRHHGEVAMRLRTSLSRQVEVLEDRSLLAALQPDVLSLSSFGGDFGSFQVTMEPLGASDQIELSAATFAGRSQFQTAGILQTTQADDFVPVDVSQSYSLTGWAKSGDEFGQRFDPANRQSFGIAEYDSDHLAIQPIHVLKFTGATDTTLSAALNPGDTQIRLTSAVGWSNSGGAAAMTRALAWYGYTNSVGQTYADFSYTRNVAAGGVNGLWNAGSVNVVTNTITLNSPWSGPALAAGTAVRNATSGSEFQFVARNNQSVSGDWSWTLSANTFGGGVFAGGMESANRFRPGTAFIKPVISANEHGILGNFVTWRDVAVQPVAVGTTVLELSQPVIDLSVVTGGDQRHELSLSQDAKPLDAFAWTQELVRVNTSEKYDLTAWSINSREQFDRPMGFASLDIDRKLIHPLHVTRFGNATDTHLAAALSPGDTSILVTNATGWSVSPFESAQTRALAWYGYSDGTGHVYPDFSYTRNVAFDFDRGLWGDGGIAFDAGVGAYRITLTTPWTGPTLAAGAAVRNATSGELFNQFTIHSTEPAYGWQPFGGTIGGGTWLNGQRDEASFRPGTAFIQPTFAGGEPLVWRDIHVAPRQASFFDGPQSVTFGGQAIVTASQSMSLLLADQLIPIDPSRGYVLSASALRGAAAGDGSLVNDQHTLGFTSFDSDGNEILPIHVTKFAGATDTTLATALNVGDTTIQLTNATGWSNLGPADTRAFAWFGYSNSAGQTYPDYSYTRNVAVDRIDGLWNIGAISGNMITLRTPWAGPVLAAGTAIRNAADGDRLNAALLNRGTIPNQWTDFSATVSGGWLNGQPQANAFRPGTAFIRPTALINAVTLSGDDVVSLRNVSVSRSDVPSGTVTADVNHQVAVVVDALSNDPLAASTALRIIGMTSPKYGSATIVSSGGAAGQDVVRYLSAPWFIGVDSFQYTAQRVDTGAVFTSTITLNFSGTNVAQNSATATALASQGQQIVGNTPPVAADEAGYYSFAYQTSIGQPLVADGVHWNGLLTNEYRAYGISGGQPLNSGTLTVRLLSGPDHGTLNLKYDGTFEYSPNPGFVGTDVFHYEVFDGLHADATVAAVNVRKSDEDLLQRRMRDIVTGFHRFHDQYSNFTFTGLQPTNFDASKNPYLSWRVQLLPYLGYVELYNQFHLNEPWNSANNLPLLDKMPDIFRAPGDSPTVNTTRLQTLTGPGNDYFWRRDASGYWVGPKIRDYNFDGTDNTLLLLTAGEDKRVPWTQPIDLDFDPNAPIASLGNLPSGRIDAVTASGTAISLHTDIAPAIFVALATMNGLEVVDADTLRRLETLRNGGIFAVQTFDAEHLDLRLRSLGLAMHNYYDTFTSFPVANNPAWFDAQGKPKVSWRVHLLPWIGQGNLYSQFHLDEPWDSANNLPLLSQMPDIFRSVGDAANSTTTRLVTFTGVDAPFLRTLTSGNYYGPKINEFFDGLSNTVLIAEAGADKAVLWTKPDDIAFDINQPLAGLGSLADGQIRTLLGDGTRLNLGTDVATATFRALVTPRGHEILDAYTLRSREELRQGIAQRIDSDVVNRFKEIGLAMHNFHDTYTRFPIEDRVASYFDAQGKPKLSWRVWLLPFIDQQSLYEKFHLDEPWDSPNNLPLLDQMPDVFRHPGDPADSTTTRVQEFTGPGAPFLSVFLNGHFQSPKISQFTDGTSNTLLAVEAGVNTAVPWTKPDDIPFDPANPFAEMGQLGEFFVALFANGVTQRLSTSIPSSVLKAYVTHRGGETISATGNVTDPEVTYGLTITPTSGLSAVEGQLATFDVVLNKAPVTDVVLTIASSASLVAAVDRTSLRFTSANWNVPQRVTVQAVDDFVVDESQMATITVAVDDPNSDNNYDPLADRTLTFTATDNDTAGFIITPTGGSTIVSESGTTETFTVVLTAQPTGPYVVFGSLQTDTSETRATPSNLTFTPANWNIPQTITITGVDDNLVDGPQTSQMVLFVTPEVSDDRFDLVPDQAVFFTTLDNDVPGFTVSITGGSTSVSEAGNTDTFSVVLDAQPLTNVVINVASSNTSEATVNKSSLTFTPANWSTPQTVTVTGVDDVTLDGTQTSAVTLSINVGASNSLFAGVGPGSVAVTTLDNDVAGFTIAQTGGSTDVSEAGATDTLSVTLNSRPLSDVVISVVSGNTNEATVNRVALTFTSANWSTPQTVVVTGIDDPFVDGTRTVPITLSIQDTFSDDGFDPLSDQTVSVSTADNDVAGFTVTQTGGSTVVSETGTTDTFSVVLNAAPLTDVVVQITSGDVGEATVAPATLTFSAGNWYVAQTVTVAGVDDTLNDGNQTTVITLSLLDDLSNDAFDLLADQTVLVTTIDVNHRPTISDVSNQTIDEDTPTPVLNVTVGDVELPASNLTLTATSSNTMLVPNANLVLLGSGPNRSIVVTPATNQSGSTTITVTVSDGVLTASDTFIVTVNAVNDVPTISDAANQTTDEDVTIAAISFTIGDVETVAASLTVTVASSDTSLIPTANLLLDGSGANRTLTIAPAANQFGSATITLTVSDGNTLATDTFLVTVNSVNDLPTISDLVNRTIDEDTSTSSIPFSVGDVETAAGSLTVTATSSNASLVPGGNLVFAGSGANRTLTVTPAANQSGSTTITVTVSDDMQSSSDTFVLTVNAVNDIPTISAISGQTIDEDTPTASITFTIGDVETASDSLTVTATSANGTLVPNGNLTLGGSGSNRTLIVVPASNQFGTSNITVTVSDDTTSASSMFLLTVTPVADAPTLSDLNDLTTNEDTATAAIPFTIGDLDTALGSLVVTATSSDTTLIPVANLSLGGSGANRTLTMTPAANRFGSAAITVTVSDGTLTTSDTFIVTVAAVNDAPVIGDLVGVSILEDSATSPLTFQIGDVELPAADLTVTVTSSNANLIPADHISLGGSGADRTLTLAAATNQFGNSTITISVSDGVSTTTGTFVLTVTSVNDLPTISDVVDQSISEDAALIGIPFTIGDVEASVGSLTVTATSSNTSLVPNGNIVFGGSGANRTLTVTPAANQFGSTQITIRVSDGVATTTDTFELTVTATNDTPMVSNLLNQSVNEDSSTPSLPFTVGDLETSPGSLTVTAMSSDQTLVPDSGIVLGGSGANRTIRLTPAANRFGTATITVTVSDGELSATDTFLLTVNGVNDAPTISSIVAQTTLEDTPLPSLEFTIGDLELPAAALTVTATSTSTVLIPAANLVLGGSGALRTLKVTPAANLSGTANVTVTVSDGQTSASTVFTVTVTPVNDAPVISDIASKSTDEDTATPAISFVISDLETAAGALTVTAISSDPLLVPNGNLVLGGSGSIRTITALPVANQFGVATITVTVSDGTRTTSDVFDLTVHAVNDRPTLTDLVNQTILEDSATSVVPFVIGDLETLAGDLVVTATSSNGTLVPSGSLVLAGSGPNRTLVVTPAANQSGTATITVQVSDGSAVSTDSFVLTVSPVNDPPTLADLADQSTDEDVALILPLSFSDNDTPAGSLKVTVTSSDTTLIPATGLLLSGTGTNRSLKITPVANRFGSATITVKVNDGTASATDTFVLTVNSVNDRPTISDITNKSTKEDTATSPLSFTVGDLETAATNLTVTATSSNTTLIPNAALVLAGTGASRTLKATPAANQFGNTTITVAVSDGTTTTTDTFVLTVTPVNDPPTISNIPNQSTRRNTQTPAISFTISDLETAASSLTVSGSSSNTTLVPNANIVFGGSGANRTVRITPAANRTGTATITVRVRDGSLTATDTFVLTVAASSASLRSASLIAEESPPITAAMNRETSSQTRSATITTPASEPFVSETSPSVVTGSVQVASSTATNNLVTRTRDLPLVERLQLLDLAFGLTEWIEWL